MLNTIKLNRKKPILLCYHSSIVDSVILHVCIFLLACERLYSGAMSIMCMHLNWLYNKNEKPTNTTLSEQFLNTTLSEQFQNTTLSEQF